MEKPQPDQVKDYPAGKNLTYLFRKRLTQSNTLSDLMLIGGTSEYLRSTLPQSMLNEIGDNHGLHALFYAPKHFGSVTIKRGLPEHIPGYFRLCRNQWVLMAAHNEFFPGDAIDCWADYRPLPKLEGREDFGILSLVMQKVVERPRQEGWDIHPSFKKLYDDKE